MGTIFDNVMAAPVPMLLFGPYAPPSLRKGNRANCLARDCEVVITGWSSGPISWPRCRAFGTHGGGSGILVEEELARAVRSESAAAVGHWWGAGIRTVAWWRRMLGVTRKNNEGSRRLIHAAAQLGAAAMREYEFTDEDTVERSERALRLNLGRNLIRGGGKPLWTREEIQLLGTQPDDELAKQLGKSQNAVRLKRQKLGIANPVDRRLSEHRRDGPRAKPGSYWLPEYRGRRLTRHVQR